MAGVDYALMSMRRDYDVVRKRLPAQARKFRWLQALYVLPIFPLIISSIAIFGFDDQSGKVAAICWTIFFLALIATGIVKSSRILTLAIRMDDAHERDTRNNIFAIRQGTVHSLDSLKTMAAEMKKQSDDIKALSRVSGDTIISGNITVSGQGVVIIGSELINSMNQHPGIADELKILAGFVQKTGDDQSKEVLNELMKRTNSGESKVVTGALWERLVKLLPSIESLTDVFIKLSLFFVGTRI